MPAAESRTWHAALIDGGPLRIAMLAPPWIPVPPPGYGGIEEVVRLLCAGLVARGHEVTLFAPPGSSSPAEVRRACSRSRTRTRSRRRSSRSTTSPARSGAIDAAARAGRAVRRRPRPRAATPRWPWPTASPTPLVHTLHGPFTEDACRFYAEHGRKARIVAHLAGAARRAPARDGRRPRRATTRSTSTSGRSAPRRRSTCSGSAACRPTRGRTARSPRRARPACRSCSPGRSSPARSSTSPRRSSRTSAGDGIEYVGEADAERKRELYRRARGAADADPLARAVRPRDGRVARLRHAGDRVPRGLGARGRRATASPASSSTTSTRWPTPFARLRRDRPGGLPGVRGAPFGVDAVVRGYEEVYRRAALRALRDGRRSTVGAGSALISSCASGFVTSPRRRREWRQP